MGVRHKGCFSHENYTSLGSQLASKTGGRTAGTLFGIPDSIGKIELGVGRAWICPAPAPRRYGIRPGALILDGT